MRNGPCLAEGVFGDSACAEVGIPICTSFPLSSNQRCSSRVGAARMREIKLAGPHLGEKVVKEKEYRSAMAKARSEQRVRKVCRGLEKGT